MRTTVIKVRLTGEEWAVGKLADSIVKSMPNAHQDSPVVLGKQGDYMVWILVAVTEDE
jgi:hypothetical protein